MRAMSDASNPAPRPSVVAPRVAAATPGDVTISSSSPAATNELDMVVVTRAFRAELLSVSV